MLIKDFFLDIGSFSLFTSILLVHHFWCFHNGWQYASNSLSDGFHHAAVLGVAPVDLDIPSRTAPSYQAYLYLAHRSPWLR
jgi:hypothetical protein